VAARERGRARARDGEKAIARPSSQAKGKRHEREGERERYAKREMGRREREGPRKGDKGGEKEKERAREQERANTHGHSLSEQRASSTRQDGGELGRTSTYMIMKMRN
jgi:hypothetical protein